MFCDRTPVPTLVPSVPTKKDSRMQHETFKPYLMYACVSLLYSRYHYTDMPSIAFTCGDQCDWDTGTVSAVSAVSHGTGGNGSVEFYNLTTPVSPPKASLLRRAYYAALTLMDSQVGRVLDELRALDYHDNTVVVLHGDHGWGLGEGNSWHKMTNFEHTTRVPLMVRVPWKPKSMGTRVGCLPLAQCPPLPPFGPQHCHVLPTLCFF